ncbi:MAG: hypothetical protein R3246_00450 [Acidimicrobiia bacterium]|nr:hypothetical protein [Acidimicrobiia bacterium]
MTKKQVLALIMVLATGLSACSPADADGIDDTIDDATAAAIETAESATDTTLSEDSAESLAKLQTTLDVLTAQLAGVELDPSMEAAWSEIQVRVTDAVVSARLDMEFDQSTLVDSLDAFEDALEQTSPSPDLWSAWNEFRDAWTMFVAATG